ncbi:MAG: peptidoglycan DD-metalloendopeptidase family protein [Muribaculaceae bacterium]|nr:peptidoglycan DD-metalloendopeptidase family protein [Muribaculaceae bacterium]
MKRIALILMLICMCCFLSEGRRNSRAVRKDKEQTARQITETHRKISANTARTERELAQLERIQVAIDEANGDLTALQRKRDALDQRTKMVEDTLTALEDRLTALRASYSSVLRSIRRQRSVAGRTSAIFASQSASQAARRLRYLDQLAKWEKNKAAELKKTKEETQLRRQELETLLAKVADNESAQQEKLEELSQRRQSAEQLVESLKKQGKNLQDVLNRQKAMAQELERELQRAIEEESQVAAPSPSTTAPVTGTDFAQAKGKLMRPIAGTSTLVSNFGRRTHEEFEKVTVQNNGVDFEAPAGAKAVAVFPGTVSMVIVMQGYQNVVLIRHGEYLTVYAGLTNVLVRKGDAVKAGDELGTLQTSPSGTDYGRLHFEVRHEKEKLNPSDWLRP